MRLSAKKKRQQNQGAAIIVAIVVGVVVMVFDLSLLLVSYSLFSSVTGKVTETQCKELAKSVSKELRQELMDTSYESYELQCEAVGRENNLWFFLRYNLWQDEAWPYYNDGETGHKVADSYRYFNLDVSESGQYAGMADRIQITIYWEIESENPGEETDKSFTILHIRTDVEKGDYSYAIDTEYTLNITAYEGNLDEGGMESISDTSINPYNREIATNEKWMWTPN